MDASFDLVLPKMKELFDMPICLSFIKEIDHAEPLIVDGQNTLVFKTPFGCIPPINLSSGVKSLILIVYRSLHPELTWIPSMESMGTNAKQFLFDHFTDLDFPLFCTSFEKLRDKDLFHAQIVHKTCSNTVVNQYV